MTSQSARHAISIVFTLFGCVFLAVGSMSKQWFVRAADHARRNFDDVAVHLRPSVFLMALLGISIAVAVLLGVIALFRPRPRAIAVVNALLAACIALCAVAISLTAGDDVRIGPAFSVSLAGAVFLGIGSLAVVDTTADTETGREVVVDQGDGRRFVYRGNEVVAIEHWKDGQLVSSEPFRPKIAGQER